MRQYIALIHKDADSDYGVSFPDLPGFIQDLRVRGFKISLWELPYISAQSTLYAEAARAGYFLLDDAGEPICAALGLPPADGFNRAVVDLTNPAARAWWQDLHRPWLHNLVIAFTFV